jgi:hypothetical protein
VTKKTRIWVDPQSGGHKALKAWKPQAELGQKWELWGAFGVQRQVRNLESRPTQRKRGDCVREGGEGVGNVWMWRVKSWLSRVTGREESGAMVDREFADLADKGMLWLSPFELRGAQ